MVPNGFDERGRETLDGLPPREKRRGLGAVKTVLIAAALCAALLCTAFAASPELRGMLAEALGGFAPYAQGQEGEAYVIDGIEFRVVSALADDFTVRAYVEARELEGDRLSKLERNVLGGAFGLVDVPIKDMGNSEGSGGGTTSGVCLDYDPETKTALLAVTSWGQVMADDLSGAEVKLFSLSGGPKAAYRTIWENSGGVYFPVEIKPMPSLTLDGELASGLGAEEVRISSLGLSVIFKPPGRAARAITARMARKPSGRCWCGTSASRWMWTASRGSMWGRTISPWAEPGVIEAMGRPPACAEAGGRSLAVLCPPGLAS